jgi:hypothetical protein
MWIATFASEYIALSVVESSEIGKKAAINILRLLTMGPEGKERPAYPNSKIRQERMKPSHKNPAKACHDDDDDDGGGGGGGGGKYQNFTSCTRVNKVKPAALHLV